MRRLGTYAVPQVASLPGSGVLYQLVGYSGAIYFWNGTAWTQW